MTRTMARTHASLRSKIVIGLMAKACGIDYREAAKDSERVTVGGVSIPLASPQTLIRTKNTVRPSDAADRRYLEALLDAKRRDH